jgi:hypothetical protein
MYCIVLWIGIKVSEEFAPLIIYVPTYAAGSTRSVVC